MLACKLVEEHIFFFFYNIVTEPRGLLWPQCDISLPDARKMAFFLQENLSCCPFGKFEGIIIATSLINSKTSPLIFATFFLTNSKTFPIIFPVIFERNVIRCLPTENLKYRNSTIKILSYCPNERSFYTECLFLEKRTPMYMARLLSNIQGESNSYLPDCLHLSTYLVEH